MAGVPSGRGAVPGFDLTFSAPKSVSLLWARAKPSLHPHERARGQGLRVHHRRLVDEEHGVPGQSGPYIYGVYERRLSQRVSSPMPMGLARSSGLPDHDRDSPTAAQQTANHFRLVSLQGWVG